MALISFFKQPRPRQFELKPRYYDEHKERLRESEKRVRAQMGQKTDDTLHVKDLHGVFQESLERNRADKNTKVRLGLVIGLFLGAAYILFTYAFN